MDRSMAGARPRGGGRPRGERGVALITAMLVVALATATAVSMATRQQVDIRRSENLLHGGQAWQYALGAEAWGRAVLDRDARDSEHDGLDEPWAQPLPAIPVTGGSIAGELVDLQGRLNLNNLLDEEGKVDPVALGRLQRLLTALELDPGLADRIADWIDRDTRVRPGGAEDAVYLARQPGYLAANRPLRSISELRLVKGVGEEAFDRLRPHVAALPARTAVNVNTASPEVLASLGEPFTAPVIEALLARRERAGLESLERLEELAGFEGEAGDLQRLDVASDYFLGVAHARIGAIRLRIETLFERGAGGTRVLQRSEAMI